MRDSPTIHLARPRGWLLAFAVAGFAFLAATLVPVQTSTAQGAPEVDIQASTDGISVEFFATTARNVLTFSVRVVGPDNFVFEQRVEDGTLQWIPPENLSDGLYVWEAWVVTADVGAQMRELTPALEARSVDHWFDDEVKQTHLTSGSFKVENGLLESSTNSQKEADGIPILRRVASAILDFLVPSAHAGENFDQFVGILDTNSTNNTRLNMFNVGEPDMGLHLLNGTLRIRTGAGSAAGTPHLTVVSSTGNVGIGTTSPPNLFSLGAPSSGSHMRLTNTDGSAFFHAMGGACPGGICLSAGGVFQLSVTGTGVGIFTSAPAAPLHVQRGNNTAEVRVQDTGASDPGPGQTMFNLINNGHPKFRMEDTSQGDVRWEFRTSGTQGSNERFQINKLGSGVIEAQFLAGGDLIIGGNLTQLSSRAFKERITELDPETVLARLDGLSVHEWSYQRSPEQRHLGPMAEDFHAAFGLGGSQKHISPGDLAGVALAAAKGLAVRSARLEAENAELRDRLERLEAMLLSSM